MHYRRLSKLVRPARLRRARRTLGRARGRH